MKKLFFALLCCIYICFGRQASAQFTLSENAFAALMTCGPGDEFYTTFGHSAIRICDTANKIDVVYNYGMFSFNIDNFYWTFALGDLNYWVERYPFSYFMAEYESEGRSMYMQKLNITPQELNNLFVALEWNIRPENRYYKYDFFRNNCATLARDMIFNQLCHRTVITEYQPTEPYTYRDELARCTDSTLMWWKFGIDLLLGARCDHAATNLEQMFSPLNMMEQIDTLTFSDTHERFAEPPIQVLMSTREPLPNSFSPLLTFWLVAVVVIALTVISWKKRWKLYWLDLVLYLIIGLLSLVIIFLWVISTHYCTKVNLNILWCSPIYLLIACRIRRNDKIANYTQLALLLVVLIGFWWLPQEFNPAFFPIILMLLVRMLSRVYANKHSDSLRNDHN